MKTEAPIMTHTQLPPHSSQLLVGPRTPDSSRGETKRIRFDIGPTRWSFWFSISFLFLLLNGLVGAQNCLGDADIDDAIEFDQAMFDELNMQETLNSLYRSCYQEELRDLRKGRHPTSKIKSDECKPKTPKRAVKGILFDLLTNKENGIISSAFLDSMNEICGSSDVAEDQYLRRLGFLFNHSHNLCGHVFRNSIKSSYLRKYILKYNFNDSSPESYVDLDNTIDPDQNLTANFAEEVKFEIDEFGETSASPIPVKQPITRSAKTDQFQNSTYYPVETTAKTFIVLGEKTAKTTHFSPGIVLPNPLTSTVSVRQDVSPIPAAKQSNSSVLPVKKTHLNNCTLILLNIYLLAYRATCNYEDFVDSLGHYDCIQNNFSVKSDCNKCKVAYQKWLCSSIVPYYKKEEQIKPCLRYCYNVQNQCPFFRPVDMYGGQPVFHCRNVVQVNEWRHDGYEDDDENYVDDNPYDEDTCYSECPLSKTTASDSIQLTVDVNELIDQSMAASENSSNARAVENFGRFTHTHECLFNLFKSNSTRIHSSTSNQFVVLLIAVFSALVFQIQ